MGNLFLYFSWLLVLLHLVVYLACRLSLQSGSTDLWHSPCVALFSVSFPPLIRIPVIWGAGPSLLYWDSFNLRIWRESGWHRNMHKDSEKICQKPRLEQDHWVLLGRLVTRLPACFCAPSYTQGQEREALAPATQSLLESSIDKAWCQASWQSDDIYRIHLYYNKAKYKAWMWN